MRQIIVAFIAASVLATPAMAQQQSVDHFHDAMALAIDHFNANHERDIRSWGPEHKFMYDLLNAVGEQIPAVAGIGKLGRVPYDQNDPFRNLNRDLFFSNDDVEERELAARLKAAAEDIVAGCPFRRVTTTEDVNFGRPRTDVKVEATYELDRNNENIACERQDVTDALVAAGISFVKITTDKMSYGERFNLTFGQGTNTWRDMAFVKNQIAAIPALTELASELQVIDYSGMYMIGRSRDLNLVDSSGAASFTDPVTIKYWMGWGDCPAGCINSHTWTVKVTPVAVGNGYEYSAEVIAESGSPLR